MTNEQLALLLTGYNSRLSDAIGALADKLPEDMAKNTELLGFAYKEYPCLEQLKELRDELHEDVTTLLRRGGES